MAFSTKAFQESDPGPDPNIQKTNPLVNENPTETLNKVDEKGSEVFTLAQTSATGPTKPASTQGVREYLGMLESSGGVDTDPRKLEQNRQTYTSGTYQLTAPLLLDRMVNSNTVKSAPPALEKLTEEWKAAKTQAEKTTILEKTYDIMAKDRTLTDSLAEEIFDGLLERSGGHPDVATTMWWRSGTVIQAMKNTGVGRNTLKKDPQSAKRLYKEIDRLIDTAKAKDEKAWLDSGDLKAAERLQRGDTHYNVWPKRKKRMQELREDAASQRTRTLRENSQGQVHVAERTAVDSYEAYAQARAQENQIDEIKAEYGEDAGEQVAVLNLAATLDPGNYENVLRSHIMENDAINPDFSSFDPVTFGDFDPNPIRGAAANFVGDALLGLVDIPAYAQYIGSGFMATSLVQNAGSRLARKAQRRLTQKATPDDAGGPGGIGGEEELIPQIEPEGLLAKLAAEEASLSKEIADLRKQGKGGETKDLEAKLAKATKRRETREKAVKKQAEGVQQSPQFMHGQFKESLEKFNNQLKEARVSDERMGEQVTSLMDDAEKKLFDKLRGKSEIKDNELGALIMAVSRTQGSRLKMLDDALEAYVADPSAANGQIATTMISEFNKLEALLERRSISIAQAERAQRFKPDDLRSFREAAEFMPPDANLPLFATTYGSIKDAKRKAKFLRRLRKPNLFSGSLMQIYLAGAVSSLGTVVGNTLSVATLMPVRIFERALMEHTAGSNVAPGETAAMVHGMWTAYAKLWAGNERVKGVVKTQTDNVKSLFKDSPLTDEKTQIRRTLTAENFGATGAWGTLVDYLGHSINAPIGLIATADAVFKVPIIMGNVEALALRRASIEIRSELQAQGMTNIPQDIRKLPGINDRLQKRMDEIIEDPHAEALMNGRAVKIQEVADSEANIIAMMEPLNSNLARTIDNNLRNSVPGRLGVMFYRVLAITTRETSTRLGPFSRFLPSVRAELAAGGERAAAAKAKMATGTLLGFATVGLSTAGVLTPSGPLDPDMRKDWLSKNGNNPSSIMLPWKDEKGRDLWLPLHKLGVVGNVMSFMADLAYAIPRVKLTDPLEAATTLAAVASNVAVDPIMGQDFKDIISSLMNHDKNALERVLKRRADAPIPLSAAVKDLVELIEGERTEPTSLLSRLYAERAVHIDYWGNRKEITPYSAIVGIDITDYPDGTPEAKVHALALRDKITLPDMPRYWRNVELTIPQQNRFKQLFHEQTNEEGQRPAEVLAEFMTSPLYNSGTPDPNGSKDNMVTTIFQEIAEATWKRIINPQDGNVEPMFQELAAKAAELEAYRTFTEDNSEMFFFDPDTGKTSIHKSGGGGTNGINIR